MNFYTLNPFFSVAQQDSLVLTLRKAGFKATVEADVDSYILVTDALGMEINLCWGNSCWRSIANTIKAQ